ncbi:MAG: putative basic amino acid antiporter YfcC, partial [Cetobacterium somerae]
FMCYISTQIGFATSWMNPFSVAIAQGVAGVPVLSGAMFRIVMWIFFTSFGIIYTMRYAKKVKANPELSISYETDKFFRDDFKADESEDLEFKFGHKLVFLTIFLGMSWIIWGVVFHGYYLPEIAAQFTIMGVVSGIIGVIFKLNDMTVNDIAISFRKGAEDLIGAAMVVGMAKGIVLVLGGVDAGTPTVLNTVLNSVAGVLSHLHASISAVAMYFFQSVFNFFVVSGSGQAALTMPIMAPLSDLVGVPRQVAVLAFQLGDGFTNMFVPTSGILMAILGIAKIEWGVWAKLQIKFQGILFLLGSIFMIIGVLIKLQ